MYCICFEAAGGMDAVLSSIDAMHLVDGVKNATLKRPTNAVLQRSGEGASGSDKRAERVGADAVTDKADVGAIAKMVALYVDALEQLRKEYVTLKRYAVEKCDAVAVEY